MIILRVYRLSFSFFFGTNSAESIFWTNDMHHCSKHYHSENESREDSETDGESKDCERLEVSEQQPEATSKCGNTSTEDTDSHFSVSLSHFVISCLTC